MALVAVLLSDLLRLAHYCRLVIKNNGRLGEYWLRQERVP
jgi:hypothetical protein